MIIGFKNNLDSHNINIAKSILTIESNFPEVWIEFRYFNKILKQKATIYARIINQYKFYYHILFSASFYEINEEDQRGDENEIFVKLNFYHNLTETDIDNSDV